MSINYLELGILVLLGICILGVIILAFAGVAIPDALIPVMTALLGYLIGSKAQYARIAAAGGIK